MSTDLTTREQLPASLFTPTPQAAQRMPEFFTAQINNPHTRRAYLNAARRFAAWCQDHRIGRLAEVQPVHVAAFIQDLQGRCCVIRARGEPGREAHPPQYTRSDRGIPSSAIRFSTAHLIAASTFWFLTVRAERLTPSIALYRETAFSATLWRVQPLDFRHS